MEFLQVLKKLNESKEYKEWTDENKILAHGFVTLDNKYIEAEPWQIGYYDKKEDKITTFKVKENTIEKQKPQEVFKKPETQIKVIDTTKIKKNLEDIKKKVQEYQKEKYPQEIPTKILVILQSITEIGLVWNVTLITMKLNTLNIKLDAETGDIKEDKLTSIMSYKQEES